MKILICGLVLMSFSGHAKTVMMREVDDLLRRVEALERRVSNLENNRKTSGLRVKDYQGAQAAGMERVPSSESKEASIQKKEIMKELQKYKKSEEERRKFLDSMLDE